MSDVATFDPFWEERYSKDQNYRSWYPWTEVVSFIFRNIRTDKPRSELSILEVGCGTGNNVWFTAREGLRSAGLDGSETAIRFARERLARDGLEADLRVGDFTALPFPDLSFDFAFERGALSLTGADGAQRCVAEVHRVLKPGGLFQTGLFSDRDSSFYRTPDPDGAVRDIRVGLLRGGQSRFYSLQNLRDLFANGWNFTSLDHIEETNWLQPERVSHCRWLAVTQKS